MAVFYANSLSGNDANNGSTWLLAKKTFSSVFTAAAAGDIIYLHGYFSPNALNKANMFIIGAGFAEFNGGASSFSSVSAGSTFINVSFTNFIYLWNASGGGYFYDCIFRGNVKSFDDNSTLGNHSFHRCQFYNHSGAAVTWNRAGNMQFYNCAFANNAYDILYSGSSSGACVFRNCVFRSPYMIWWNAGGIALSDQNVFDFSYGKNLYGTDKLTLAAWQSASTRDATSIDRNWSTDVNDWANQMLRPNPASYLLTAGLGSTPIGLPYPSLGISGNRNSSYWSGGTFSNTELDASNRLILSAGQTLGTWASTVVDNGSQMHIKSIDPFVSNELYPVTYVDKDTGDSPNYLNIEFRGSASTFSANDASPSWTTIPRRGEFAMFASSAWYRYWQVRLTLRA